MVVSGLSIKAYETREFTLALRISARVMENAMRHLRDKRDRESRSVAHWDNWDCRRSRCFSVISCNVLAVSVSMDLFLDMPAR